MGLRKDRINDRRKAALNNLIEQIEELKGEIKQGKYCAESVEKRMKCPKCNGDKGQWDIGNYHWYPCDFCHETGEVVGNSEQLKSRSVQREAKPTVKKSLTVEDKPDMPERIVAFGNKLQDIEYLRADLAAEKDNQIDNLKMLLEEANKQIMALKERDRQNTEMVASMTDQLDASLPADKVRELVKKTRIFVLIKVNPVTCYHRHGNKIPEFHLTELSNSQIDFEKYLDDMEAALEGVENEQDKD